VGTPETNRPFKKAARAALFQRLHRSKSRDGTGWLGRQDSNLGMAESKSAADWLLEPHPISIMPLKQRDNLADSSLGRAHFRVARADQAVLRIPRAYQGVQRRHCDMTATCSGYDWCPSAAELTTVLASPSDEPNPRGRSARAGTAPLPCGPAFVIAIIQ
jgi:hypothetical protein